MIVKRKNFSRFDATDNIKRMKDSDILAEKAKRETDYKGIASAGMGGAVGGALLGSTIGTVRGLGQKGSRLTAAGKGFKAGAGKGALIGGALAAGVTYMKGRKQAEENRFYNERLRYAKSQALRREKKDWKTNMTQRDGYSY